MRAPRPLAIVLLVLLPCSPAAVAWTSQGEREPDTAEDAQGGRMWLEPPTEVGARVYFHAFPTTLETDGNPNAPATGSRLRPPAYTRYEALLGVWRDCNGDGAIGTLDGARTTYPSALLLDDARCPSGDPHHAGGTVTELLPIGRGPSAALHDPEARVWGDAGRPGAPGIETCGAYPLPRGATSNTGRLLRALDCASEHRLLGAVNTVDNDGSLGLRVDDVHHPERSDSLLVQDLPLSLFGNPIDGRRGVLERGAPPTILLHDCASGGISPTPAEDPANASLWAALDAASAALLGACGEEGALAPFHPALEQPFEPGSHTGRDRNDIVMVYSTTPARALAFEPWQGTASTSGLAHPSATPAAPTIGDARWRANAAHVAGAQTLTRGDAQPQGATYVTFYAAVGPATTDRARLPSGGGAVYGFEACAGHDEGVRGGWACDPAQWWRDPAGDTMPSDGSYPWGARVGDLYHLRDVDCLDGAVDPSLSLYASLALLADEVCPTSP